MKLMMLTGAMLGFGIGFAFSWAQQSAWPDVIWRGCVCAYVAGLLTRWWGRQWIRSLAAASEERRLILERTKALSTPAK